MRAGRVAMARPAPRSTGGEVLDWALVALPVSYAIWNPWGLIGRHEIRLLVGLVALAVAVRIIVRRPTIRVPTPWPFIAAFALVVAASAVASGDLRTTLLGHADRHLGAIGWLALGVAMFAGVNVESEGRRHFRIALEGAAVVVAGLGLAQIAGLTITGELGPGERITSTFGSATYTGAALALALPLLVDRAVTDRAPRWRAFAIAGSLTVGSALVLTGSRGAWIGGVVGLTLVLWHHRTAHRRFVTSTTVAAIGLVAVLVGASSAVRDRVGSLVEPSSGTAGGRIVLWESGVRTVAARPLLGWGPDRTRMALPPRLPRTFEAEYWDQTVPDRAHNAIIDVALTSGIVAAILLVLIVAFALMQRSSGGDAVADLPIWRIVLLAHLPHLFFNFVQLDVDFVSAVVVGFLLSPATFEVELPVVARASMGAMGTVVVAAALAFGTGLVVADTVAARGVHAERRGDIVGAERAYERASAWAFGDARYFELLARFYRRHDNFPAAIEAADRAAAVHRDDPFFGELAALTRAEAAAMDPMLADDALDRYAEMVRRWPNHGAYYTGVGVALANTGRLDEAAESFRTALELTPRSPEPYRNLAQLLVAIGDTDQARAVLEVGVQRSASPEQLRPMLASLPPTTADSP